MSQNELTSTIKKWHEWTEYASDFEIVFVSDIDGKVRKVCEWCLISDKEMHYTAYNRDGSVNTYHVSTGDNIINLWHKYHTKRGDKK